MTSTIAVVTGAGQGIGLAFARRFADDGHRVIVTDIDGQAAERAAAEIGRGAIGRQQDVRDLASADKIAAEAAGMGQLHTWVNNAGILLTGPAWEASEEQISAILEVNVRGVMSGCRAAINHMDESGGRILNLASISALTPVPGLAMYAATKAAVLSYTTSLQGDLLSAGRPIKVKALCPDVVGTKMVTDVERDPTAAVLFSGPKPISTDQVVAAGMGLLDSRQIFRVTPRWRGALVRSIDASPAFGVRVLNALAKYGSWRQKRL